MSMTQEETLELIESDDIKFVRLAFCDVYGVQKNISIQSAELERAFSDGIAFDASSVAGFRDPSHSDLFLIPDPDGPCRLAHRDGAGLVHLL